MSNLKYTYSCKLNGEKNMKILYLFLILVLTGCSPMKSEDTLKEHELCFTQTKYATSLAETGESAYREGVRCGVIIGNVEKCTEGIHEAYIQTVDRIKESER